MTDGGFTKAEFLKSAIGTGATIVTRLRKDAALHALVNPAKNRNSISHPLWEPGQPRKYGQRINLCRKAARSLDEGYGHTLTVNKLGLSSKLRRLFGSTNMIESCLSRADDLCGNVKRWRNANMAWRWAGTVLLEAEKSFHRIIGYRQMPMLIQALSKAVDRNEAAV